MKLPKLTLPKNTLHKTHPYNSMGNHTALLDYCMDRVKMGAVVRDGMLPRFVRIDKTVAGWLKADTEDKKRMRKQDTTGEAQATKMNLPLTYVHLDDMMTYFAATFAPNRGMFYHTANPDDTESASQVVAAMNNHAIYGGYYRQVLLGIFSLLKYNQGGFEVNWEEELRPKIVKDSSGKDTVEEAIGWRGNKMNAIDVYNFLRDPSVSVDSLHSDGEFAGTVKLIGGLQLLRRAAAGEFFNCESLYTTTAGENTGGGRFYRCPPEESKLSEDMFAEGSQVDWVNVLTAGELTSSGGGAAHEIVRLYIRLNPAEFDLIPPAAKTLRSRLETWRITILNGQKIIQATYMNNVHGHIPCYYAVMNDDLMGTSQKSNAEIIAPLQHYASHLVNTHVQATRKNLWGGIAYDKSVIDLGKVPPGEVSWRIPMESHAAGKDIRTAIWEHNSKLETGQTLDDLQGIMSLVNMFFPTQSLPSQIANIDRAVDSQVAAVQQGASRRQHKAAKLLDDSLFRQVRFSMYYNLLQYAKDGDDVMDFASGKQMTLNLEALRKTDLPYIIGQGLKALDRQATQSMMQQVIFALIQAPKASEGIDLLGMIDHWTSMMDVEMNMKQFRIQQQPVQPGVDPAAAGGTGINPATNPQALTDPIYAKGAT